MKAEEVVGDMFVELLLSRLHNVASTSSSLLNGCS